MLEAIVMGVLRPIWELEVTLPPDPSLFLPRASQNTAQSKVRKRVTMVACGLPGRESMGSSQLTPTDLSVYIFL